MVKHVKAGNLESASRGWASWNKGRPPRFVIVRLYIGDDILPNYIGIKKKAMKEGSV